LLVRSCWNYHHDIEAFRDWLTTVETLDTPLYNPLDVIRWNHHKFYLQDLEKRGIPILDSVFVEESDDRSVASILDEQSWTTAVVKPAVGTSSEGVRKVSADDPTLDSRPEGNFLVQRFAPEINDGERSLVFFGDTHSHAWRSVPDDDEFRSHNQFGGHVEPFDPPEGVVRDAREALRAGAEVLERSVDDILYARVDGIEREGQFLLMELELIEPFLGLERGGAVEEFANRIADSM
jgi:glutathione synthase/RimK-type ligase-like ATP-grasp enzyme